MKSDRSLTTNSQLPKEYKQTEVGVIPDDWLCDGLDKFWTVTDCKHVTAQFIRSGFPVASIKEVQSRYVDLSNANQTTDIYYKKLIEGGRKPQAGDLILSRNATVGEIAQVGEWHPLFAMGQDVCLLRKKSSKFSTSLLQAIFQSPIIELQLENCMVGSTFRRVNVEQIKNLVIPLPSTIAEQNLIARALSDTDALIESLEQLLAKKRQIKQGAMQELLRSKDTWDKEEIRNILTLIMDYRGRTPKKLGMEWGGGDIRALSAGNVKRGWIDFEAEAYFASEALYQKWMTQGVTKENDILVTTEAPLGNIAIIPDSKKYILSQRVISLRTDPQIINSKYLYHYISSEIFQELLKKDSSGSTATGIQRLKLEKILIAFPSLAEQQAIATILSDMDLEIGAIETKLTKARQLKQGMMHELLTGKIRLIDKGNT